MRLIERIMLEEQEFPRLFANFIERPYGTLFHNENIKDHHDSNHAVIYPERIDDLSAVLCDIVEFYGSRGIEPIVYHPFAQDYFLQNAAILKQCGFAFTIELDRRIMVLTGSKRMPAPDKLRIRRIGSADMDTDFIPDGDEYLRELFKNSIGKDDHYVFVGYFDDQPASLLSFHVSEHGCTRFDEMCTAVRFQGKGFAREMNNFAANFCMDNKLPPAYQWPAHDTSERITTEAGFHLTYLLPGGYATYARIAHYSE